MITRRSHPSKAVLNSRGLAWIVALSVPLLAALGGCRPDGADAEASAGVQTGGVQTEARIVKADAEPQNWLSTGRNYQETRFSPLAEINAGNVGKLGLQWSYDLDTDNGQEATPIVVDGVLYVSSAWSKVHAFDAVTGKLLWQFDPKVPRETLVKTCCDAVNRGVAYWEGKVYVAALDGRLIAVDATTGKEVWSTVTVDQSMAYTMTGAPRIAKGLVFIGNGGAELGVRGYVSAYDAQSGKLRWRFYTVPGEPGKRDGAASDEVFERFAAATWSGNWWKKEGGFGGGTVWDSMSYDPELGLLYIGVGNGSYWNKKQRSPDDLDNLFVGSIVALNAETGAYVWHYQQTPGDAWDYTSTQHMILADLNIDGATRKVIMQAPKNGYFYVLDRTNGKLISAKPYIPLNWSDGIDMDTGRPRIKPEAYYWKSDKLWLAMPGPFGGHNWHPMSHSPATGLVYIPAQEVPGPYQVEKDIKPRPVGLNIGVDMKNIILPDDANVVKEIKKSVKGYLLAWDPVAQKEVWRAPHSGPWNGGVVSTAGNLVFQGDIDGGFNAYDATSGKQLWSFATGNTVSAAPVTYSVNGRQYVTVLSGWGTAWSKLAGKLAWDDQGPRQNKSRLLTFALDGKQSLAAPSRTFPKLTQMPEQFASPDVVAEGAELYHQTCFGCHGAGAVAGSSYPPDLRYSGFLHGADAWNAVVLQGVLASRGMVSFQDDYSPQQAQAIRAYIISRTRQTLQVQANH